MLLDWMIGEIPIVNDVAASRGSENSGPIDRYNNIGYIKANNLLTRFDNVKISNVWETPSAINVKSGKPTADIKNPRITTLKLLPLCWPI